MTRKFTSMFVLFGLSACTVGGTPANRIGDADGNVGPWVRLQHPCFGNRTDAMWFDDASTGFVGCGSTTEGYGVYETVDGGLSWTSLFDGTPLEDMRVDSISRGSDGVLYLAGTGYGGFRVITLVDNTLEEFYSAPSSGAQPWQTFQVGTFRTDGTGRAVSESLTGTDVMYWPDVNGAAVNGYGWWNQTSIGSFGAQILDLEVYNDRFYGVGSTISQPPYFYYEAAGGMGNSFAFEAIQMSDSFDGEIWDLAIDGDGAMMAAGVDENSDTGVLWYTTGDPTQASSWEMYNITPIVPVFPTNSTRFYGACRAGDTMVAIGDYSQEEEALIVYSLDGGANWNITAPPGYGVDVVGPLSKCQIFGDQVYVTGSDGFFGILDTTSL